MDIEKYYSNFFSGTKDPSLDAMNFFMERLGHPEKKLKFIHIAGTNGKGSTTEMISNILIDAGYKVGKYMTPQLIKLNERTSINNINITDAEFEALIKKLDIFVHEYNSSHSTNVTQFEFDTALAIEYFYEKNCDIVVLEAGLGGTYDCTNIVHSLISIITSIGLDHMDLLGNTLEEIASQKAGIIKSDSNTIFVQHTKDSVNNVIINRCNEVNSNLHLIKPEDISNYSYNMDYQSFNYKEFESIIVKLKGVKQIYNASIAIECSKILINYSFNINETNIRNGIKNATIKARLEKLYENPTIYYEGGHNLPAIENFLNSLNMYFKNCKKVFIFQILKTKDYKAVLDKLIKYDNSTYIFTDGNDTNKYVKKEDLLEYANSLSKENNYYTMKLNDAIDFAKKEFKDEIVFILGSFYIYGDVIELLKDE